MSNPVEEFHKYFYDKQLWASISYCGIPIFKNPFDLQIYHELIFMLRPDLIIETGTAAGGSALWFAHQLDNLGIDGKIISIDINDSPDYPYHPKIEFWKGSSTSHEIVSELEKLVAARTMVVLDSNHQFFHVYRELSIYHKFVSLGMPLIVEDTNISGHPVDATYPDGGPYEAVEKFLAEHKEFSVDKSCEKLEFSFNPNGYLVRRTDG